jgi:hypothetical protein
VSPSGHEVQAAGDDCEQARVVAEFPQLQHAVGVLPGLLAEIYRILIRNSS